MSCSNQVSWLSAYERWHRPTAAYPARPLEPPPTNIQFRYPPQNAAHPAANHSASECLVALCPAMSQAVRRNPCDCPDGIVDFVCEFYLHFYALKLSQ